MVVGVAVLRGPRLDLRPTSSPDYSGLLRGCSSVRRTNAPAVYPAFLPRSRRGVSLPGSQPLHSSQCYF